jgi:hypothetical protein
MSTHGNHGGSFVLGDVEDADCRMSVLDDPAGSDSVIDELEGSLPNVGRDLIGLARNGKMEVGRVRGDDLKKQQLARVSGQKAPDVGEDRLGGL